jgi:hypothetical protein
MVRVSPRECNEARLPVFHVLWRDQRFSGVGRLIGHDPARRPPGSIGPSDGPARLFVRRPRRAPLSAGSPPHVRRGRPQVAWAGRAQLALPGFTPVAAQVRFDVRLAEQQPAPGLVVAEVANEGRFVYLHPESVVRNDDIIATWVADDGTPVLGVGVRLRPEGGERLRRATTGHVGRPLAILIDGAVVMAPVVRSPIGDEALVTGRFTREEAERIAEGLRSR